MFNLYHNYLKLLDNYPILKPWGRLLRSQNLNTASWLCGSDALIHNHKMKDGALYHFDKNQVFLISGKGYVENTPIKTIIAVDFDAQGEIKNEK